MEDVSPPPARPRSEDAGSENSRFEGTEFEKAVRLVADPVRRYLHRRTDAATADDVLSETLAVLWRRFASAPGEAEIIAWTIGVARLQLANAERAGRRRARLATKVAVLDPPTLVADAPGSAVDDDVRATLAQLRPADAELLRMWAWDELAPREIATVLGIGVNAATVRLYRARQRFSTAWGKNHPAGGHVSSREGNAS